MCKISIRDQSCLVEYQKWQKVLITQTESLQNIYVNGEIKNTGVPSTLVHSSVETNSDVSLGSQENMGLNGMIKGVCLFNKVLNNHEINDIF
tara:strand:- start:239 stop:514 length:276 start_codon:yes stop_codon:yes gene_type:complete